MNGLCFLAHDGDRPEADVGLLCLWHRNRMTKLVADVRDLWVDTAFIVEAGTAPKDETPKTGYVKASEAPAPANLEVLSLRDNRTRNQRIPGTAADPLGDQSEPLPPVMEMIGSWVLLVAEERPLAGHLLPRSTIAQLNLLLRHGDWIAAQPWVDDYVDELGDLRKALSGALRDQPYRKVGVCQLPIAGQEVLCGGVLMKENGSMVVKCRSCGAAWVTEQERARLAVTLEAG